MKTQHHAMRLYSTRAERLYLNRHERKRFARAAKTHNQNIEMLCLLLLHTGCRLSEVLNLRPCDIQLDEALVAVRSLKKRNHHSVREILIPDALVRELSQLLHDAPSRQIWPQSRTTAWRQIKATMRSAEIVGAHASPKGLRHSFGVHCAFNNVPMPLAQKWMGHSDIKTTAIYYQIVGQEEREMAARLWD